ncbi:MAG: ABC transporter permease subunit [Spirochaetaceae bacterium]|jgi:ABC-2 type transport system permease protein|nr:ABC transporter permease subunit [Spirochaetaceae bacterium]
MFALMKRELSAYFTSPIGYVYLAAFWFFAGYFLFTGVLVNNSTILTPVFQVMINIVMVLMPLLTMRLLSEERRHRTDQALLTAPVELWAIVTGKFLAASLVYLAGISITIVFALVLNSFAPVNWALIWGNYLALALLGLAFIAIGEFISSLTENQVIAAIASFALMLMLFLLDALPSLIPIPWLSVLIGGISFIKRYTPITQGILAPANLFFFSSVCLLFLFLTTRVLEKRRWS